MPSYDSIPAKVGPALSFDWIFLHGLGDAPNSAVALRKSLCVGGDEFIAPDMNAAWMSSPDYRQLASDRLAGSLVNGELGNVVNRPSSRKRFLIAHSAGALVALALIERAPSFAGLILIEGSLRAADIAAIRRYTDAIDGDSGRLRLLSDLDSGPNLSDGIWQYRSNVDETNSDLFHQLAVELVERPDVGRTRLLRLEIPILYIAGALSPGASREELRPLSQIRTIDLRVVPGAAHWTHVDAPMDVATLIRSWISAISPQSTTL